MDHHPHALRPATPGPWAVRDAEWPWITAPGAIVVSPGVSLADAELIVAAVNAHRSAWDQQPPPPASELPQVVVDQPLVLNGRGGWLLVTPPDHPRPRPILSAEQHAHQALMADAELWLGLDHREQVDKIVAVIAECRRELGLS